jgi:hypothetical protein
MAKGTKPLPTKGKGVKAVTGSSSATKVPHKAKNMPSGKNKGAC